MALLKGANMSQTIQQEMEALKKDIDDFSEKKPSIKDSHNTKIYNELNDRLGKFHTKAGTLNFKPGKAFFDEYIKKLTKLLP
jgi:hypothetical protein